MLQACLLPLKTIQILGLRKRNETSTLSSCAVATDMAQQGDLGAIKMWLTAHDRSTYGDKKQVEIDATPAAVELSQNDALARIAELQATLEQRRLALQADDADVIEVESEEL